MKNKTTKKKRFKSVFEATFWEDWENWGPEANEDDWADEWRDLKWSEGKSSGTETQSQPQESNATKTHHRNTTQLQPSHHGSRQSTTRCSQGNQSTKV
jgi:hypothetical protein